MNFKPMDPEEIRRILEETDASGAKVHQDILTPLIAKEEAVFQRASCPNCRGPSHEAFVDPSRPFIAGSALPHRLLRCVECKTEYDAYTGMATRVTSSRA
jgi:hypothetical protein